jgi:predicted esterase
MMAFAEAARRVRRLSALLPGVVFCVVCCVLPAGIDGREPAVAPAESHGVATRTAAALGPAIAELDRPVPPEGHVALPLSPGKLVHAYAPLLAMGSGLGAAAPAAAAPLVVMLHGMCSDAHGSCEFWNQDGRQYGWLVCPEGNGRCGSRPDWRGDGEEKAQHIDAATAQLRSSYGELVAAPGGDVLVGFSRGAFVARDVAYARPGQFRGLVLIGAALVPDPERLRASGIRRVVLASGDHDGARPTMQRAWAVLTAAKLEARFVSLGPIWHELPDDFGARMRPILDWVRAG